MRYIHSGRYRRESLGALCRLKLTYYSIINHRSRSVKVPTTYLVLGFRWEKWWLLFVTLADMYLVGKLLSVE